MAKIRVDLVEVIRQAIPQVEGNDEKELLGDWLALNATPTQVVEVDVYLAPRKSSLLPFHPGRVCLSQQTLERLTPRGHRYGGYDYNVYLARHLAGDWGDVSGGRKADNDAALGLDGAYGGSGIFSAHNTPIGRIFVHTDLDVGRTTVSHQEDGYY
jgi:hypothetical protein